MQTCKHRMTDYDVEWQTDEIRQKQYLDVCSESKE